MPYEQRDNSGSLFKIDEKESDRHPDYTGKAMVGGTEYRLAGWLKEARSGKRYLSLAFSVPEEGKRTPRAEKKDEVDIPW